MKKTANLFADLYKDNVIPAGVFVKSIETQLEAVEDNICDIPSIFKYLGIFIARLIEAGAISLSRLPALFSKLDDFRKAPLLGEILSSIQSDRGEEALLNAYQADPIAFESFWPPGKFNEEALIEWREKYNLVAFFESSRSPRDSKISLNKY
jgi:hypothetical protein